MPLDILILSKTPPLFDMERWGSKTGTEVAVMKNLLTGFALIAVFAGGTVGAALLILPLAVAVLGVAVISCVRDGHSQPARVR